MVLHSALNVSPTETHAGEAPPHHLGPAPEAVQVHGADEPVHQGFAQGRIPPRAEAV